MTKAFYLSRFPRSRKSPHPSLSPDKVDFVVKLTMQKPDALSYTFQWKPRDPSFSRFVTIHERYRQQTTYYDSSRTSQLQLQRSAENDEQDRLLVRVTNCCRVISQLIWVWSASGFSALNSSSSTGQDVRHVWRVKLLGLWAMVAGISALERQLTTKVVRRKCSKVYVDFIVHVPL